MRVKSNDTPLRNAFIACLVIATVLMAVGFLSSCDSCNKKPVPVVSIPETIEAKAKPVEDSLRKEVALLRDSINILKVSVQKAEVKKEVAREKKKEASANVAAAELKGDSLAIINSLKSEVLASEQYIRQADQQATDQGEIIVKQEKVITKQLSDIALQDSKFKELATAFTNLKNQYGQAIDELKKSEKKLHRAKVFNKIFGIGTAAGIGLAAIIFL